MVFDKEAFMKAGAPKMVKKFIPALNGEVAMIPLSLEAQKRAYEALSEDATVNDSNVAVLRQTLCDGTGELMFSKPEGKEQLEKMGLLVLKQLVKFFNEHHMLDDAAVEEAEKNSEPTPSDAGSSESDLITD